MEYEEEKKNQVLKYLELIDISSEDDFLIASPFYDSLEDLRLSGDDNDDDDYDLLVYNYSCLVLFRNLFYVY